MKLILSIAMAGLVCAGCATQIRSVTSKDGTVTTTKTTAFLQTIQGYSDQAVSPDGILYSTTIQNLTGDVQMVMALDQFAKDVASAAIVATGNTNIIGTNVVSVFSRPMGFAVRRPAH